MGLLVLSFSLAQGPNYAITFTVTGDGESTGLTFGFSPIATDEFDEGIDVSISSPDPTPGVFYSGLKWNDLYYSTQIINGSNDDLEEHLWLVELRFPTTNVIEITWDNTGWETLGTIHLTDILDGLFGINVDMTSETSLTLNNPAFTSLKLKVTPCENCVLETPPIADAGSDQIVMEADEVQLNGSNSFDPGLGTITFNWQSLNGITLSDSTLAMPVFTAPDISDTTDFYFSLTVENEDLVHSEPDTVKITVLPILPVALIGPTQEVYPGDVAELDGSFSYDPGGTELQYFWSGPTVNGQQIEFLEGDPTLVTVSFLAPDVEVDTVIVFTLRVVNEEGLANENSAGVTILGDRTPTAIAGRSESVDQGTIVELDGSRSWDPRGSQLQFLWSIPSINGQPVEFLEGSSTLPIVTFLAPDVDVNTVVNFTLLIENEEGYTNIDDVNITILENKPPTADAGTFRKSVQGGSIVVNGGLSSDINNDQLSYMWVCDNEALLISDPTIAKPTITLPAGLNEHTDYDLYLTVTDEHGSISESDMVTVTAVTESLQPPVAPNVYARVEHQKVVLAWDDIAESSIDPMTGYSDFEGYKVYKSLDGGKTWGKVIYDTYYDMDPTVPRDTIGWEPIAQFDLTEEQDRHHCFYENAYNCDEDYSRGINIEGLDPLRREINLGSNSGLAYTFIDTNVIDGVEYTYAVTAYDMGLPTYQIEYFDENGDGSYYEIEEWSQANPEHFISYTETAPHWGAYKSLENSKTDSTNFITVIPGYYATNITFPDLENVEAFIVADEDNIGSGDRLFELVDVNALTPALMRFEIEALPLTNSFEGKASKDPKLYVYEITDSEFQEAADWIEIGAVSSLDSLTVDSLQNLPGALVDNGILHLPNYKLEAFPIIGQYELGYTSNWTDFFDGIRVRFDNYITDFNALGMTYEAQIESFESNMDSTILDFLDIRLEFVSNGVFDKRPIYKYKIEFGTTAIDTAGEVSSTESCEGLPHVGTPLPFRITNLTTGKKVKIYHRDNKGHGGDYVYDGTNDCMWERGEKIGLKWEEVYVDTTLIDDPYIYDLIIDYRFFDYIMGGVPEWDGDIFYEQGTPVKYADMIWIAGENIIEESPAPNVWLEEGNPWKPDYGWKDGDYIIITPERWYVDGDSWVADLSLLGKPTEITKENLEEVKVVPNPYIVHSEFNETANNSLLQFIHLPQDCQITIYSITGEYVTSFEHHDEYFGYEYWDLRTDNNQEVAPGLYIFRVLSSDGEEYLGKFAVVR